MEGFAVLSTALTLELGLAQRRAVSGNQDELGLAGAKRLQRGLRSHCH